MIVQLLHRLFHSRGQTHFQIGLIDEIGMRRFEDIDHLVQICGDEDDGRIGRGDLCGRLDAGSRLQHDIHEDDARRWDMRQLFQQRVHIVVTEDRLSAVCLFDQFLQMIALLRVILTDHKLIHIISPSCLYSDFRR